MTSEEITEAVFKMKLNKAPGLDGLNVEFYRKFWPQIQKILTKVYNESYTHVITRKVWQIRKKGGNFIDL